MRGASDSVSGISELVWLPIVDAYRTLLTVPSPELRALFDSLSLGDLTRKAATQQDGA